MKKSELLQKIDQEFLDRLYGFCYGRTRDSYEAQELCSDILLALVKGAGTAGKITDMNAYIWHICKNVYADFSRKRAEDRQRMYTGDPDELFALYAQEVDAEDDTDLLNRIYRGIGLLSKAYRDVMIAFYLDGSSTKQISSKFGISETTVRQRLFAARKNVQNEVLNMENTRRDRVLEIFFRGLRGEDLCVQKLADEYEVSTKSITRCINDIAMSIQGLC